MWNHSGLAADVVLNMKTLKREGSEAQTAFIKTRQDDVFNICDFALKKMSRDSQSDQRPKLLSYIFFCKNAIPLIDCLVEVSMSLETFWLTPFFLFRVQYYVNRGIKSYYQSTVKHFYFPFVLAWMMLAHNALLLLPHWSISKRSHYTHM